MCYLVWILGQKKKKIIVRENLVTCKQSLYFSEQYYANMHVFVLTNVSMAR